LNKLRKVDPVQLVYEFRANNIFPHFVMMTPGTYNEVFYEDVFRTRKYASERLQWLDENVGKGSQLSAGQYPNQKWFTFEWSDRWGPYPTFPPRDLVAYGIQRGERELLEKGGEAVCFREENDALLFKMRWG
jgi:hypothetical protein